MQIAAAEFPSGAATLRPHAITKQVSAREPRNSLQQARGIFIWDEAKELEGGARAGPLARNQDGGVEYNLHCSMLSQVLRAATVFAVISRGRGHARSYQLSEEIRLSSPRDQRVSWIAGLYGLTEDINSQSASARLPGVDTAVPGPSNYSFSTYEHNTQSFAAFASATAHITDALSVSGGLRWNSLVLGSAERG